MVDTFEELFVKKSEIEKKIAYTFTDKKLLMKSFIHRSYVHENQEEQIEHNERLEFLGDSVLGLIMADYLFEKFPTISEGELSYLRSRLVEASSCAAYLQALSLQQYLLLGRGESLSGGKNKSSILADVFEALIGAIYIDGGFSRVKKFLFAHFMQEIENILSTPFQNFKALLQEYSQKKFQVHPEYKLLAQEGPDHQKIFTIAAYIAEKEVGIGKGLTKKEAEQKAAQNAWQKIKQEEEDA